MDSQEHPPSTEALLDCIESLLETTELNLDEIEEDTREAIADALNLLMEHGRLPTNDPSSL